MTDKTGSSNRSSSNTVIVTDSSAEWIWSKYYCNSSAVNKVIDQAKLKESVHKKMRHWRITGNSNVAIQTGSTYISESMTDITEIPTANLEFSTTPTAKKLTRAIAMTSDNRKQQYRRFGSRYCNFWKSIVVAIIWLILCRARHHRKSRSCRWNLDAICQSSRDVIISGFVNEYQKAYIQLYYIQHDTTLHYAGHSQTPS